MDCPPSFRRWNVSRFTAEENQVTDPAFSECTQMIIRQVDDLKKMVNEFSQFARLPQSKPITGELNDVVEESLMVFRQAHPNVRFEFNPDEKLPNFKRPYGECLQWPWWRRRNQKRPWRRPNQKQPWWRLAAARGQFSGVRRLGCVVTKGCPNSDHDRPRMPMGETWVASYGCLLGALFGVTTCPEEGTQKVTIGCPISRRGTNHR